MLQLAVAEVPTSRDQIEHEMLRIRGEIEIRELYFSRLAAALTHLDATVARTAVAVGDAFDEKKLLPLARLRAAGVVVRRTPHRALDQWRWTRAREHGPALSTASLDGA